MKTNILVIVSGFCSLLFCGCAGERRLSHLGPFHAGDHVKNTSEFYVPEGPSSSGRELVTPADASLEQLKKRSTNILVIPVGTLFKIEAIKKVTFRHEGWYASSFHIDFFVISGEHTGRTFDAYLVFMNWQPSYARPPGGFPVFIEKVGAPDTPESRKVLP